VTLVLVASIQMTAFFMRLSSNFGASHFDEPVTLSRGHSGYDGKYE